MKDDTPDAVFVFVPSGFGAVFMKQFVERGLDKAGIKLIGTGDVTDDDLLGDIGDAALGAVTTHHYSAAHDSPENKAFVEAFEKANGGMRPNFMAVGAYDGMALVYQALEKTKGATDGDALMAAMKGLTWTSPRGQVTIDPETRDIVQTIYVRKVEKVDGQLYNVEFERDARREGPLQGVESAVNATPTGMSGLEHFPPLPASGERVGVRGWVVGRGPAAPHPAPHPNLLPASGEKGRDRASLDCDVPC